jgi:hypothetical protein
MLSPQARDVTLSLFGPPWELYGVKNFWALSLRQIASALFSVHHRHRERDVEGVIAAY